MFTIKHIEEDGRERFFTAQSIERNTEGQLAFGSEEVIQSGKIYIMNDAGKTVAVYDFTKKQ